MSLKMAKGADLGFSGFGITQEPCKQEHLGVLPHPSEELGVGKPSDLTQLSH